ncbi:hypothetical protein PIB30_028761 [Stylosanthes scabra]|uniref:START domain-containing protein n=1 Tax=Stylosanthes scabra TaxID=79078 RepID=A0ABU6Y876_9FABA|nr:hypothetical protein [Stylosanthes scabra]
MGSPETETETETATASVVGDGGGSGTTKTMMMEGWLFLIQSNRLGLQFSRKRYFVLKGHHLRSYKYPPSLSHNHQLLPLRSAVLDSTVRVLDNGRETINRKLGASCPEEAARWIHSIQESSLKGAPRTRDNSVASSKRRWHSFRLCGFSDTTHSSSVDWTLGSSDVIAPSSWTIFGCQNGLRLFKEAKERDSRGKKWDDHPAIMAVGVVDGSSEAIFQTLMSLGPSRSAWDFCFYKGNVVEHVDGHTDIIHKQLYRDWLPWGSKPRDFLLQRYWRREDDGTYGSNDTWKKPTENT